jgi:hypothetical protein
MDRYRVAASLSALLSLSIGCGGGTDTARPTATPSATVTAAAPSPSATATRLLPTASATASATHSPPPISPTPPAPTPSGTPTASPPATVAPTSTATPQPPEISYFGVARADDLPLDPIAVDAAGRPVFARVQGQGMTVVLEAKRGGRPLDPLAFDPTGGPLGVEFLVSRPLGDGSVAVCDIQPPDIGGVPGTDPPVFSDAPAVLNAISDLGCRVNDGTGAPRGRAETDACTRVEPTSEYGFVDASSDLQYCLPIAQPWSFPMGDTIVAARVRDTAGLISAVSEIVVRVQSAAPFQCDSDSDLGERVFTVTRPGSRLLTSLSGGGDASVDPWLPGPLRICAGPDLGGGVHPLNLRADAVLGFGAADGSTICAKLTALGSTGSLACSAGTPADVLASQDAEGLGRVTVETGLGLDAGTGAAVIRAPIAIVQLPPGASPDACTTMQYPDASFTAALTTATGTAQVLDRSGAVVAAVSVTGVNFDCPTWRDSGPGTLVLPFPAVNTSAGAVAEALVLTN